MCTVYPMDIMQWVAEICWQKCFRDILVENHQVKAVICLFQSLSSIKHFSLHPYIYQRYHKLLGPDTEEKCFSDTPSFIIIIVIITIIIMMHYEVGDASVSSQVGSSVSNVPQRPTLWATNYIIIIIIFKIIISIIIIINIIIIIITVIIITTILLLLLIIIVIMGPSCK